jgi:hypothetical protein
LHTILTQLHYPWQRRWLPLNTDADSLARPCKLDAAGYANL